MTTERSQLASRTIPKITLGDGSPGSLSGPLPPLSHADPKARVLERFSVTGNAIVTGGTGDLGFTACQVLLEHGARGLAIFDLDETEGAAKAQLLREGFPEANVRFMRVNVTDEARVNEAVREAAAELGSVDVMVCFAGVVSTMHAIDTTAEQFRVILDINLNGSFICARAAASRMIEQGTRGSIILTASISAHRPNWPQPQVSYNVSKAGVLAMKDSLAAEWGVHGIRVNTISPGYMDTILNEGAGLDWHKSQWFHRHPMGRMGQPEEIMGAVILLASRAGVYITGEDIRCDGGQILMM
ncbi:NAD(P)-binding protein [Cryphonectria parasitica EP155]|uniref:NAD(P)-binding protein n=1 Tax=Cryphonectria parasitica (strain ATCC 38755 / EP155) TaxID=660469 RepID=A0A9P4Y0D6_CRYP1|nr:NAD(P)-binding protein [Cryphonectria parasitica EP155]KAF3764662.1 NAD(P)-binding protein [Cryphonectria parasitica EP155]